MKNRLSLRPAYFLVITFLLAFGANTANVTFISEGALDIRIHPEGDNLKPPAELLVTDPAGRKAGVDPRINKTFAEIPDSSYERESIEDAETGSPGPETSIIYIRNPVDGEYRLKIIGTASTKYSLEITGFDCEMGVSKALFEKIPINQGETHCYLISYTSRKGSQIEVRRKDRIISP